MAEPREYVVWVRDDADGVVAKRFGRVLSGEHGLNVKQPLDEHKKGRWARIGLSERFYPWHVVVAVDTLFPGRAEKPQAATS